MPFLKYEKKNEEFVHKILSQKYNVSVVEYQDRVNL